MQLKSFRSKISIPISLFLFLIYAYPFYEVFKDPDSVDRESALMLWIIMGITIIFTAYILFGIRYHILQDKNNPELFWLHIKIGHFTYAKIDISQIRKIQKTRNIISSPASSMDRLEVYYNQYDSLIISPKNKHDFVEQLSSINPKIEVDLIHSN